MLAFTLVIVLTTAFPSEADASHWFGYKWRSAPVGLTLIDATTGDWPGIVARAAAQWNVSSAVEFVIKRGPCQPKMNAVVICNANYGAGVASFARLSINRLIIRGAVIQINDYYYGPQTYIEGRWAVTCQELGHTLGLDHDPSALGGPYSCMGWGWQPGPHDYEQLLLIYGP